LNAALPGGILGDVHRGVRHGRDAGALGRGLRAVAWERSAGQAVQLGLAALVLSAVPSPVRSAMPIVLTAVLTCLVGVALVARAARRGDSTQWARASRLIGAELRAAVVARERWPGILASSAIVVVGHAATFLIAARDAGATAPFAELIALTMLVLVAAGLPTNVGGWGPREGVAAWAFAAAGLGGATGVAAATAYGVLAAAASLPGAVVLIAGWLVRRSGWTAAQHDRTARTAALQISHTAAEQPVPVGRNHG
jgi:hypothetical protein